MLISHTNSSHLSFAKFWGKTDVTVHVPSTCIFPCRCILVKCANVTVIITGGYVCRCVAGESSWTPSQDRAAWKSGGYVSCVWEGHGVALKEAVQDLKIFLECFTGLTENLFFSVLIKSQYFVCQHGKEKLLEKSSRIPFKMSIN